MDFSTALEIINKVIPETIGISYDGIIVKRLEASNTLDEGRTTNQTHIAITGNQMDIFPYLAAPGYFDKEYDQRDELLKKYFIIRIPIRIFKSNIERLGENASDIPFNTDGTLLTASCVLRSRRKGAADQVQLSLTTNDDANFIAFRRKIHAGTYLVALKRRELFQYDFFAVPSRESAMLDGLNNLFFKEPTKTTVLVTQLENNYTEADIEENEYKRAASELKQFVEKNSIRLEEQKPLYEKVLRDFQDKFSPEKLRHLQDGELLKTMFYSEEKTDDSLCYWLEFVKDSRLYWGSISGGSAYRYGLFWRKETGRWTTGSPQKIVELSEDQALELGKQIRDIIVKGADIISKSTLNSLEDYEKLDDDLKNAMGEKYAYLSWIHKYFGMIFPDKLSGYHSNDWQRHVLYALRIMPSKKYYARSGQIAMVSKYGSWLYPDMRVIVDERFGKPKKFLKIGTTGDNRYFGDEWKKKSIVAIGWKGIGSLEDYVVNSQIDKKSISDKLFEEYYSADIGAGNSVASKKAGELVAFYNSDENSLFVPMNGKKLLGIVDNIGSYYFDPTSEMPHIKKGHWIECFESDEKLPYEYAGHLTSCSEINDDENLLFLYERYYYNEEEKEEKDDVQEDEMENKPKIELVFKTNFKSEYARNRIVFGAPGTGKSHKIKEECEKMVNEYQAGFERVTFHPDYTYSQFVGTYKPVTDTKGNIRYDFVPGPFMRIYVKAIRSALQEKDVKPYILIVEELNRAKVAAVFGDVFQLLDRDDDGVSEYGIQASEDIKKYLAKEFDASPDSFDYLMLPDNMYIWATMNSADQGVFPMDTAFKRRWNFDYLGINEKEEKIKGKIVLGSESPVEVEWNILRKAINDKLTKDYKINEDKLIGPFFLEKKLLKTVSDIDDSIQDRDGFIKVFKSKVLMYLFEDAAKQHKHKLFSGCGDTNKYSSICDDFDRIGIRIFGDNFEKDYYDPLKG